MQERDIPEKQTGATMKQNNTGGSTRAQAVWIGPPGLSVLTVQNRMS